MLERQTREIVAEALKHWREAFGLALQLTGDRSVAEDLCQEAYLKLCEPRRNLDLSRSLRPYLLTIVRNLAVSRARRRVAAPREEGEMDARMAFDPRAPDPGAETATLEEVRRVRRHLEDLSPTSRAVLYLRDGLGHSTAEVAAILDKTEETVRVTLHRARRKIRGRLGGAETGGKI